ncbi:hypothetical protein AAIH46_03660 [Rhizobium sp. 0TCS1.26]|uniref:hypothetical protein n=1 Tax=Rhizobium sp. 0TCS1.26 TaxID=3142623 RepID=UPI003D27F0EE
MRTIGRRWRTSVRRLFRARLRPAGYVPLIGVSLWLSAGAAIAQDPGVDWGNAGKGAALPKLALPAEKPTLPGSGFDCGTVTVPEADERLVRPSDPGGKSARTERCSRDGFSLELRAPPR